ncbi:hypothetical protein JCM5350_007239 [Sporobolomyces pararoseus]
MSTSSTTPTPSTTAKVQCVVCGKETYLRCAACNSFGTDWMFFCSVEHQRLIWKVHRSVCGARSNPFQWPRLSQEDVDDCRVFGVQPVMENGLPTRDLEMDRWLGGFAGNRTEKEARLDVLLKELQGPEDKWKPESLSALLSIRRVLFSQRFDRLMSDHGHTTERGILHIRLIRQHPFDWLAQWLDCEPDIDWTKLNATWLAGYLHRQLIHLYLGSLTGYDHPHARHAGSEVERFAGEVIAKTHPNLAALIVFQQLATSNLLYGGEEGNSGR